MSADEPHRSRIIQAYAVISGAGSLRCNAIVVPGNHDIDIAVSVPTGMMTTNYDALFKFSGHGTDETIRVPHHGSQPIRLHLCEAIVALTASKGRIDELLGDHRTELQNLVRQLGVTRGTWICRLRLAGTVIRMIPAIAVRVLILWRFIR